MDASSASESTLIKFNHIFEQVNTNQRKVKVVCTIGHSLFFSVENLVKMIDEGMNVARFDFSRGDHQVSCKNASVTVIVRSTRHLSTS